MRLAIFVDQVFWQNENVLSTDESYILFPASFVGHVDEIVFIGREASEQRTAPYVLDDPSITLFPLPYYPNLYQLWRADPRIYQDIRHRVRNEAKRWDALLVSGPHPIGQMIARECIALGVPVALMVRQNFVEQMRAHTGFKRIAATAAAHLLEWDFKRLARGRTVFTVGMEMAREYGRFSNRTYNHFPCLVDENQFRMFTAMSSGNDPTRLLCVCRLAPEKGHRFLFEAMAKLRSRGLECHLDIVGTGVLENELKDRAVALGLAKQVTFHGYVPYGPDLFNLYQQAGALVLPSLTEGFPQVINESLCIGLPTVATAVGGVPSFLTDGESALLVPPSDVDALSKAIERIIRDQALRAHLRANGRNLMEVNTLEANRTRVINVLHSDFAATHA